MELEKQVVSLDLSKKLKELGVKQESLFWWNRPTKKLAYADKKSILMNVWAETAWYSAFTVAELGEMLPKEYISGKAGSVLTLPFYCKEVRQEQVKEIMRADTEADARAKMLIYLLENKLIQLS